MSSESQATPSPPPEPEPIPDLGLPETFHEPFPLIAKLIKFIQTKRG